MIIDTEVFEKALSDICIRPNAIDFACILDFRKTTSEKNAIKFEPTQLSKDRYPDVKKLRSLIQIERQKFSVSEYSEERFETYGDIMVAWIPIGEGFLILFASRDALSAKIFLMAVDEEKEKVKQQFKDIRAAMSS